MDLNGDWSEIDGRKFDTVLAAEVIEHLYFPQVVVDKISKVLDSNGTLIITVPNAFSLKNRIRLLLAKKKHTPLGDPTHINHFTVDEMISILSKNYHGIEVHGIGRYKYLSKLFPQIFAFDLLFKCNKK